MAKSFKHWVNQLCGVGQGPELATINGEIYQGIIQGLSNGGLTRFLGSLSRLSDWAEQCSVNTTWAGTLVSVLGSQAAMVISTYKLGPFSGVPPNSGL